MTKCALCLKNKKLQNSHLIPKSIYKAIRNSFPTEKGGNLFGRIDDSSINYSDYQVKEYLLCHECEELLNKHGENIVSPECYHGFKKFKLLEKLHKNKTYCIVSNEKWYMPKMLLNIDIPSYLYFGISVFWRASVGNWNDGISVYKNALGKKYQEQIRQFLLGQSPFPKNIYLGVYVDRDVDTVPFISFPVLMRKKGYHHHVFYLPGLRFSLIVGNKTNGVKKIAQEFNSPIFFIEYSFRSHKDFKLFHQTIKNELSPKGRLLKEISNTKTQIASH